MSLGPLLAQHRIVVCVGSGGVGKTTTAAALALFGAMSGRRAVVLTIDPARRLAQSLGLDALRSGGERIGDEMFAAAGLSPLGSLTAGMLDQKSAWDDFIARHAPSPEVRDVILRNEFYQHLSQSFAGSTEYMAVEELCRLSESDEHDLIVLDTPPTGHALDFLEAPLRLENLLDRTVLGWLVKPYVAAGWTAWKTASRTVRFVVRRIEEAAGITTLGQVSEFFVAMDRMFDGIAERSRKVRALLAGPQTAFVLVAGPEEQVLGESEQLTEKMLALGMPLKGVVMNRIHPVPAGGEHSHDPESIVAALAPLARCAVSDECVRWIAENYINSCTIARAEEVRREAFESGLGSDVARIAVPEFDRDVHDLAALMAVADRLCG
jgi:anion-transporting  ArsA/GET3 family ATPase